MTLLRNVGVDTVDAVVNMAETTVKLELLILTRTRTKTLDVNRDEDLEEGYNEQKLKQLATGRMT